MTSSRMTSLYRSTCCWWNKLPMSWGGFRHWSTQRIWARPYQTAKSSGWLFRSFVRGFSMLRRRTGGEVFVGSIWWLSCGCLRKLIFCMKLQKCWFHTWHMQWANIRGNFTDESSLNFFARVFPQKLDFCSLLLLHPKHNSEVFLPLAFVFLGVAIWTIEKLQITVNTPEQMNTTMQYVQAHGRHTKAEIKQTSTRHTTTWKYTATQAWVLITPPLYICTEGCGRSVSRTRLTKRQLYLRSSLTLTTNKSSVKRDNLFVLSWTLPKVIFVGAIMMAISINYTLLQPKNTELFLMLAL